MNLRILKKLSKRAAPLLPLLGDNREQFLSEAGDSYHGLHIRARKHWERSTAIHGIARPDGYATSPQCRTGHQYPFIHVYPPLHPWPRTAMIGGMTGYYEPEWDEETAYGALATYVHYAFMDYTDAGEMMATRPLRTPRQIFAAAAELIAERSAA